MDYHKLLKLLKKIEFYHFIFKYIKQKMSSSDPTFMQSMLDIIRGFREVLEGSGHILYGRGGDIPHTPCRLWGCFIYLTTCGVLHIGDITYRSFYKEDDWILIPLIRSLSAP